MERTERRKLNREMQLERRAKLREKAEARALQRPALRDAVLTERRERFRPLLEAARARSDARAEGRRKKK